MQGSGCVLDEAMNADTVTAPAAAPDYRLTCRFCTTFKTHKMQELLEHQERGCPASPEARARKIGTRKGRR